jgi:Predicted Rossmann fold nucleotide-binding protein
MSNDTPTIPAAPAAHRAERVFLEGPQTRKWEFWTLLGIMWEFIRGFRVLHFVGPCVTVFGSARFKEDHPFYAMARQVGNRLTDIGFTVMTGGGPGSYGGGEPRRQRGRRHFDRLQHRFAARAVGQSLPRSRRHVPLFLCPQSDAHQVLRMPSW